jgi:hypothetical protein
MSLVVEKANVGTDAIARVAARGAARNSIDRASTIGAETFGVGPKRSPPSSHRDASRLEARNCSAPRANPPAERAPERLLEISPPTWIMSQP